MDGVVDGEGKRVPLSKAIAYGWIRPTVAQPGWGLSNAEVPLGENLFVDGGRQFMAYLFGGRSPMANYFCQKFGMGTGTTPAAVNDVALVSPVAFDGSSQFTKNVNSVDFPTQFIARVTFTIGAGEGNGYLLTEFGLFSGSDNLLARLVQPGISKTSDFAPSLIWRIRF